jgi:hypothetical protein
MSGDIDAQLAAWRAQGAQRVDPQRFALIEALARRAAGQQGPLRARLDQRVAALLADYAGRLSQAHAAPLPAPVVATPAAPLRALLAQWPSEPGRVPELKTVRAHRATWSRLATEQRLNAALAKVPENAGPLNTQRLLHEALQRLRAQAPQMLQHLVSQVDALLWLEQASRFTPPPAGKPTSATRPSSRRPRP